MGAPKEGVSGGGGGAAGLHLPPIRKFKSVGFVDTKILKVLYVLPFNRNRPLISADY
jgi:hypothetical protein